MNGEEILNSLSYLLKPIAQEQHFTEQEVDNARKTMYVILGFLTTFNTIAVVDGLRRSKDPEPIILPSVPELRSIITDEDQQRLPIKSHDNDPNSYAQRIDVILPDHKKYFFVEDEYGPSRQGNGNPRPNPYLSRNGNHRARSRLAGHA